MFSNIGMTELLVILGIAVLLFGSRLPGVGKALGEGIKNFKKGIKSDDDESDQAVKNTSPTAQNQVPPQAATPINQAAREQQVLAQNVSPRPLAGQPSGVTHARASGSDVVDVEHRDPHK